MDAVQKRKRITYLFKEIDGKIKNQYQIPNNLRSCHSAQIANYTIEGHVPIESINKLLREKPSILSLIHI